MAKATDGLAFGTTRHCRIKGYRPCRRPQRQDLMTGGGYLQECNLKNLETLLLEPLKTTKSCPIRTMKTCLSHCETSATRQSLRKLRRERIRKGRAPAGFASKPLRNCNLKNLETLRLEPLKTMKSCPSHCETSATRQSLRKLRRRNTLLGALPLSEGSVEPQQVLRPSHCGTATSKISKRCV